MGGRFLDPRSVFKNRGVPGDFCGILAAAKIGRRIEKKKSKIAFLLF
jgi:hypothetical protein